MLTETIAFESADGATEIDARLWMPDDGEPQGIVQIVHGMAEHIDRYADFAGFLTEQGFGVCAESHIGHGKSAENADDLGYMPPDGKHILIDDVHMLRTAVQGAYDGIPYFIFGHSMGSFITRVYLSRYGDGLTGAVICGTGNQPRAISEVGRALALALCRIRGPHYRSELLDSMGAGGFGSSIEDARTGLDWLSTDPLVVDAYLADEMCGRMFTVGAYATLLDLTGEAVTVECASAVPHALPLLFIGGGQDPVGDFGNGVLDAADLAERAGSEDVTIYIYEDMRHEILNEPRKSDVYRNVFDWMIERAHGNAPEKETWVV